VQELALTQKVLADAGGRLRDAGVRGGTTTWLRARLRLRISGDTPVITIAAVDGRQAVASAVAKAETDALVNAIDTASKDASTKTGTTTKTTTPTRTTTTTGTIAAASGIRLQVFSTGEPRGKVQPETGRNVLLGASAGLIVGCFVLAQLLSRESRRRSA
jgi:capsular polysaccharide biosynthesis protein